MILPALGLLAMVFLGSMGMGSAVRRARDEVLTSLCCGPRKGLIFTASTRA